MQALVRSFPGSTVLSFIATSIERRLDAFDNSFLEDRKIPARSPITAASRVRITIFFIQTTFTRFGTVR